MDNPQLILGALSLVANVVLALIVYSFKATIRVSILEAVAEIHKAFATKEDVGAVEDRLREQIGLRQEMRDGFAMLSARGRDDRPRPMV